MGVCFLQSENGRDAERRKVQSRYLEDRPSEENGFGRAGPASLHQAGAAGRQDWVGGTRSTGYHGGKERGRGSTGVCTTQACKQGYSEIVPDMDDGRRVIGILRALLCRSRHSFNGPHEMALLPSATKRHNVARKPLTRSRPICCLTCAPSPWRISHLGSSMILEQTRVRFGTWNQRTIERCVCLALRMCWPHRGGFAHSQGDPMNWGWARIWGGGT